MVEGFVEPPAAPLVDTASCVLPVFSAMANLKLKVSRAMEVVNADAEIEVRGTDNELIGRLLLSKGTVDWVPKGKHLRHTLTWNRFDAVMKEHGRLIG